MKKLLVFLLIIATPSLCYSAPTISSTSGTIADGRSLVITGGSFGAKTNAAPYVWDNFDSGTDGNEISGQTPSGTGGNAWGHSHAAASGIYSDENLRDGSGLNSKHELSSTDITGRSVSQLNISLSAGDKVYFSCWYRHDWGTTGDNLDRQIKIWRIFHEGYPEWDRTYTCITNWVENSGATYRSDLYVLYDAASSPRDYITPCLSDEKWVRFEAEYKISSATETSDGIVHLWISQPDFAGAIIKHVDRANLITIPANGDIWDGFFIGQWMGNATEPFSSTLYYDDVYFDTTWQRVEIGDNATWANCTHREIQVPSSWSATSITVTLNKGSFDSLNNQYLFVVDADGNASLGHQLINVSSTGGTMGGNANTTTLGSGGGSFTLGN